MWQWYLWYRLHITATGQWLGASQRLQCIGARAEIYDVLLRCGTFFRVITGAAPGSRAQKHEVEIRSGRESSISRNRMRGAVLPPARNPVRRTATATIVVVRVRVRASAALRHSGSVARAEVVRVRVT